MITTVLVNTRLFVTYDLACSLALLWESCLLWTMPLLLFGIDIFNINITLITYIRESTLPRLLPQLLKSKRLNSRAKLCIPSWYSCTKLCFECCFGRLQSQWWFLLDAVRALAPTRDFVWDGVDEDDRPATADELQAALVTSRKHGRPVSDSGQRAGVNPLDREVLAAFHETGPVWQTRMNEALKDWLRTHSPA